VAWSFVPVVLGGVSQGFGQMYGVQAGFAAPCSFTVDTRYWHDVAFGRGALLNVLTGGRAVDLNLHHEFGGCCL